MYIVGGTRSEDGGGREDGVSMYNTAQDSWDNSLPRLQNRRYFTPAVFIFDNHLYAAGGNNTINTMESLDLQNSASDCVTHSATLPFPVSHSASVQVGDKVFISGGKDRRRTLLLWSLNLDSWKHRARMNKGREDHCTVSDGSHRLWAVGGCQDCWPLYYIEEYNIARNTWTPLEINLKVTTRKVLTEPHVCVYCDGSILLYTYHYGEEDPDLHIYKYNVNTKVLEKMPNKLPQLITHPMIAIVPRED